MKHLLLSAMLLAGLAGCTKKAYPTALTQLLQGTWQLKTTAGTETLGSGSTKPPVTRFKSGDIFVVWTATTIEEHTAGGPLGAVPYTLVGNTITTKAAQGQARTGQILTLTKDKLEISWAQNTTLTGGPGTSTVICNYVK